MTSHKKRVSTKNRDNILKREIVEMKTPQPVHDIWSAFPLTKNEEEQLIECTLQVESIYSKERHIIKNDLLPILDISFKIDCYHTVI